MFCGTKQTSNDDAQSYKVTRW